MTVAAHRILVPVDFRAPSRAACEYLALLTPPAPVAVILLHVLEPPTPLVGLVPGVHSANDDRDAHEQAERRMGEAARVLRRNGWLEVTPVIERGHPTDCILERAQNDKCDLILMGTMRRHGLQRLLLGSVTEYVLRRATCPVMTLHVSTEEAAHP